MSKKGTIKILTNKIEKNKIHFNGDISNNFVFHKNYKVTLIAPQNCSCEKIMCNRFNLQLLLDVSRSSVFYRQENVLNIVRRLLAVTI